MDDMKNQVTEESIASIEPGGEPAESSDITHSRARLPIFSYIFFGLSALALIVYICAMTYTPFADVFNRYISSSVRFLLAAVTNIIPLSVAELTIIFLPVIMFFIIRYANRHYTDSWHDVGIFVLTALSFLSLFFSLFVFGFGTAYHTTEMDERLGLEQKKVTKEELASTAEWLISEVNSRLDAVEFADKGPSASPHTIRQTNNILLGSYEDFSREHSFMPVFTSYIKPIMLSKPMTYTHISGVYTYMTGEANLNTNGPDYSIPFTVAHELAHQRGIAREDEANFIAFLICTGADDPYINYCGYMNLCEYVLNALYRADKKLWEETYKKLDNRAIYEMIAYNDFYEPYRDNIAGDISGAVNDTFLQLNGTEGSVSYGLVVDLAVAYHYKNNVTE